MNSLNEITQTPDASFRLLRALLESVGHASDEIVELSSA